MSRTRSARSAVALVVGALAAGALALDAGAATGFALTRVAGSDRYGTAAAAATTEFGPASADALLARGDAFPDALAGAYLAGASSTGGAPILLTQRDALPSITEDAIGDLGVDRVFILGGTGAVSQGVEDELGDVEVIRVAGDDRYETAAEAATILAEGPIGEIDGAPTAILASGETFPDALAAGPLSFAGSFPILLTPSGTLSADAESAMDDLEIEHVLIVGGTAAVSTVVETAVEAGGRTAERIAGPNRYATAVAVANFAEDNVDGWSSTAVDLASGTNFPDALAGGAASGAANRPILLTDPTSLSAPTEQFLEDNQATLTSGRIYGGTGAVSTAVETAAETAGAGTATGFDDEGEVVAERAATEDAPAAYSYIVDGAVETVEYDDTDDFTVDGQAATIGGFTSNLNPGDRIEFDEGDDTHHLTNVNPASITNRTVGNIDLADDQLDFINDVSGDAIRSNVSYATGTYRVDGQNADLAGFEADLNEGDVVTITGTVFELTNKTITGEANDLADGGTLLAPTELLQIGPYGDIPAAGSDGGADMAGQDDRFSADADDTFVVDGDAEADFAAFSAALTEGDEVSHFRVDGEEHYTLVNQPLPTLTGNVTGGIDPDGSLLSPDGSDGGTFTMETDDGDEVTVEYTSGGTFVIDGAVATEAEFESELSVNDDIVYRPADSGAGQTQRIELEND